MPVIIVVAVSFSRPPSLLRSFSVSPLLLTTVCRYSIAYTFYRNALSRCSLCRSRRRALYFRTSNYRNNTHTQCCYATEPVCCCSKKWDTRARIYWRRTTHFQICHANEERKKKKDENVKHNCYTNNSITEWRLWQLDSKVRKKTLEISITLKFLPINNQY